MHVCIVKISTMLIAMIAHDISIEDRHMTYIILFHIILLYICNIERKPWFQIMLENTRSAITTINNHK